jgi:signal transduction histidine kinase
MIVLTVPLIVAYFGPIAVAGAVGMLDHIATKRLQHEVALCLIASPALALVTVISSRLHLNVATVGFLYVIIVALVARAGGLVSSILATIVAGLCLAYLAPPAHTFRIDDPLDAVAVIAFLTTSLIITRLVSKLYKMADEARSSVSRRLIDAEDQERSRIARELHDDITQRLGLLAATLEGGLQRDPPFATAELRQEIEGASKELVDLSNDVQALSHRLHSSKLEYLGLATAAAGFCRDFSFRHGVEIIHSENIPKDLPKEVSICLFRVLQEALQNATKHSGSQHFEVSLSGGPSEIQLTVRDSGKGFDPKEAMNGKGLGLISVRERLKLVSGDLSIDSYPQRGTTIQARVPLTAQTKSAAIGG